MNGKSFKTVIFTDTDAGGIIHVANIKGGVGKSTVATNLAAALSKKGPTLLIDLDVQGSATVALGKDPTECSSSSWNLFSKRYVAASETAFRQEPSGFFTQLEHFFTAPMVASGEVTSLVQTIQPGLYLIPATTDLFNIVRFYHLQNFLFNLKLCRNYYNYIVLDTPSVWNHLTRTLFLNSGLNLVPVTLNALSTKSLKKYLEEVQKLSRKNPSVRIRIVKNEVFGKEDSKIKGKTRTMVENRRFLDLLCEQTIIKNESGVTMVPQSIIFDMEIPESAAVRDAQDEGKPLLESHQYSAATKAFDELAKRVTYVLNSAVRRETLSFWEQHAGLGSFLMRSGMVGLAALIFFINPAVRHLPMPRPIAPQQLILTSESSFSHTFTHGESMFRLAKYAISRFCAIIPSQEMVSHYVNESIALHNNTRLPGESRLSYWEPIPRGTMITFYPPLTIRNPDAKQLVPVYRYFISLVKDPYPYLTGDWCERGTGGGQPHYGLDVAAGVGTEIISPIDGTVFIRNSISAGRVLGVVGEGYVIFFAHMDKRYFESGTRIYKGMAVGTVGMTGKTSGPHAHIGYGIRSPAIDGVPFGGHFYKLTDPKLFFYREIFLEGIK